MTFEDTPDLKKRLSYRDIQIYARQLIATLVFECLDVGTFNVDLSFFNPRDKKRIISELRIIARSLNTIEPDLPRQKAGRPQNEENEDVESN